MAIDYAPYTGFGPTWNTQARFGVYFQGEKFSDWSGGAYLPTFEMLNGPVVTQYMGRMPIRITMPLFFESVRDYEYFDSMLGQVHTLRYVHGVTRTAGGTLNGYAGIDYLVIPNVILEDISSVENEGIIDGYWECVATFRTDYVAPVIPDIVPAVVPGGPFPLPVVMFLSPGGSNSSAGVLSPTLSGSARVVETDVVAPGYETDLPDGRNYWPNPYFAGNGEGLSKEANISVVSTADGAIITKSTTTATGAALTATVVGLVIGQPYTLQADFRAGSGSVLPYLLAAGLGSTTVTSLTPTWVQWSYTFTAVTSTQVVGVQSGTSTAVGASFELRNMMMVNGATTVPFIDPLHDPHAWFEGTTHLSQSVRRKIIPASKNWILNPRAAVDLTNIDSVGGYVPVRVTGLGWTHPITEELIDTGVLCGTDYANALAWYTPTTSIAAGTPVAGQFVFQTTGSDIGKLVQIMLYAVGGANASATIASVYMTSNGTVQHTAITGFMDYSDRTGVMIFVQIVSGGTGKYVTVSAAQLEIGLTVTPFFDGASGALTSWTGTANNSPSTRLRTPSVPAWEVLEATTNIFANPHMTNNADWWTGAQFTRTEIGGGITKYGALVNDTTAGAYFWLPVTISGATAGDWTASVYIYWPQSMAGRIINLNLSEFGGATANDSRVVQFTPVVGWQRLSNTKTFIANDRTECALIIDVASRVVGDTYVVMAPQIEKKVYATPLTPQLNPATGAVLPGYAWTGSAHNSASTRADGYVSVGSTEVVAAGLTSTSGSASAQILPTAGIVGANGSARVWEIGGWGSAGSDHIDQVLSRPGSAELSWTSQSGGPNQSIIIVPTQTKPTFDRGLNLTSYASWSLTEMHLEWSSTGGHEEVTGPRTGPAPFGVWQAGNATLLKLGSAGYSPTGYNGLFYNIVFFSRPLTPLERDRLTALQADVSFYWSDF